MTDSEKVQVRVPSVFEEPSAQAVAATYADAFLAAADTVGVAEGLEEFESFLCDVLQANPEFERILLSNFLNTGEAVALIDRVLGQSASEFFVNFLRVLARHQRLELLPLILRESKRKHELATGRQRVQVVSPQPLTEETLSKVHNKLNETLPFDPIIEPSVDSTLLGGLVIRIGDTVYDTSLRTRMKQLRERLSERNLNEIQSGRDRFSHPEGD